MRVLHTSDWHLGRSFHGASLGTHQETALAAIVSLTRQEQIDLVVISGDLYDRAIPPVEAVELLSETLAELRSTGATVVTITGNHDSAVRVGFASKILAPAGVHLCGDVRQAGTPVIVPTRSGESELAVYPIPYLDPACAGPALGEDGPPQHDRLLRVALGRARHDLADRPGTRSLAVAHAFVTGGQGADSERALSVGGSAEVGLGAFHGFDYAALGHLHGRQTLGDGRVRYAGSPLAYSFSERNHVKGVWIIDLPTGSGPATVVAADLPVPRPLRVVEGPAAELCGSRAYEGAVGAWVQAIVTDPAIAPDAMAQLRRRFPHLANLIHLPPLHPDQRTPSYGERTRGCSDRELFRGFWHQATGQPVSASIEAAYLVVADAVSGASAEAIAASASDDGAEPLGPQREPMSDRHAGAAA